MPLGWTAPSRVRFSDIAARVVSVCRYAEGDELRAWKFGRLNSKETEMSKETDNKAIVGR
jgi:hypothetical protein